ncbi:hypothetical protein [Gordonia aichiensis]
MTDTPTSPKANAVKAAVGVARTVTEGDLDRDQLDLLVAGLTVDQRIADGDLTPGQIDAEVAAGVSEVYESVERGSPFWAAHLRITEQVLEALSVEERTALWHRTNWADIVDDRTPELVAPAPSEPLTADEGTDGIDGPPTDDEPAQGESDASEVVDAEVVEDVEAVGPVQVGQTTPSQRRYNVEGGYAPGNNPLARRIGGGNRPQITVGGAAADWP